MLTNAQKSLYLANTTIEVITKAPEKVIAQAEANAVDAIRTMLLPHESKTLQAIVTTIEGIDPKILSSVTDGIQEINNAIELHAEQISALLPPTIKTHTETFYKQAKYLEAERMGFVAAFIQPDEDAIARITSFQHLFIGAHYKDDVTERAKGIILDTITESKGALSRREVAAMLKEKMSEIIAQKGYWEVVASQVLNNARSYASLNLYNEAQIREFEICAVGDERTSAICRFLDGKMLSVEMALSRLSKYDEARSIDDVKSVVPWLTASVDGMKIGEKILSENMSGKDLQCYGVNAPPYHAKCRTTVLAVV
ncbi:MAG: hypothetical protein HZC16_03845 [Candidatus Omnitrophica bacterium]|nr:hypothetical protein [Candidatus Omnitrophota bacterium]